MLHMCIHSYLYRLYLKTIDIPAIPPKFIAHLLTHLLAAVLGHSLEFLLLLRGHPVVLLSFWMNGHTLAWCKGNFAETLLQSSSIYFTIYHFLPSMIFLYTHIISYHWYSRIQFSKPQCTPLFSILSNRTQKGTTWIHLEILRTWSNHPHAWVPTCSFGDPLLATTGFVGVPHATPLIALDFAYGTHQKNKRYSPILIDSPISGCPIGKIKNHQLSKTM